MSDDKVLKPKSFRIDDETADKFKEIASAIGGNQQETLSKLIEAYEFQSGKAILTEKKSDIDQFEKYVNALTRMYMSSLEDNQNITEVIRTEFDAQLKSKDAIIQELQEKLTVAKQLKEESSLKARSFSDENARLNELIEKSTKEYELRIDNMQDMLDDKDNLNRALTDSCNDLKRKIDIMKLDHEKVNTISKERDELKIENDVLQRDKVNLERDLKVNTETSDKMIAELKQHETNALERAREKSQLELDKAMLELEKKYQTQIQQLKEQKQLEIDKYQQKYFDLLEQFKAGENNN